MVTSSQTPPKPFTLMIGDDPVYSLDTDRRRIGIGTRQPRRRLHIVTPDAEALRIESEAAAPTVELTGSGGTGSISYDSAAGQWSLGTDLESTDTNLAVDVLSVPDGSSSTARIELGDNGDLKLYHDGTDCNVDAVNGALALRIQGSIALYVNGSNRNVSVTRGLTVNTTAASSALVVDDGTGNIGIGGSASGVAGVLVSAGGTAAGVSQSVYLRNTDNTTGSSDARLWVATGGSSGGDPMLRLQVVGQADWTAGIDNSDSDSFKITPAATPGGATAALRMTTSGLVQALQGFVVPVVADATAEGNLIAAEGALCFRQDTNKHRGYDGSAWNDLY